MLLDPATALVAREGELTGWLAALGDQLAALRDARGTEQGDDEHDPEGSTLAQDWSRLVGLRAAAAAELAEVVAAQARLADGRYGVCERCRGPVGDDRLAARPAARRCVRCAAVR